jgi:hypothetical protein
MNWTIGRGAVLGLALATPMVLGACGGEEASTGPTLKPMGVVEERPADSFNAAPTLASVKLNPPTLAPGIMLNAVVEGSDPDGDAVRMHYEWRQNGRVVAEGRESHFRIGEVKRGDRVEVIVTASDGRLESPPMRAASTVNNRPPLMTGVYLTPDNQVIRRGDVLVAHPEATDPDNDRLEYRYRWLLGDRVVSENREFDTSGLRRGEKLVVEVVAHDGRGQSEPRRSRVTELGNSPPHILTIPAVENVSGTLHYGFEAEDPDGDRNLRFWLEQGPAGMAIDSLTGQLSWTPTAGQAGKHPVEVGVKDGQGDGSTFTFEVTVNATTPDPAPPAAPGY